MRTLAVFAALIISLALPVFADQPMSRIRVEVKNVDEKPIERASVVVHFVQGRSIIKFGKSVVTHWELRTNQEGVAKIPSIPQGKVRIQVIAKGYQTFGEVFEVTEEEKTIQVKLNPPQPPYSSHQ